VGVGYLSPPSGLATREQRLVDAANLRRPDRVPVAPLVHYYAAASRGTSYAAMHYDLALRNRVFRETTVEHDWDAATPVGAIPEGRPLELLGTTQYRWPGGGLDGRQPFQFVEAEYMLQDEYDEMLADPAGFVVRTLWPRVAPALRPAAVLGRSLPPLMYYADARGLAGLLGGALSAPETVTMLEALLAFAKDSASSRRAMVDYVDEMAGLGYPMLFGATALTAFDCVSDFLRGLRGTMLDMYQVPDKLLAAIELFTPWTIEQAVSLARTIGNPRVFIALHRGAGSFMSNEQFAKFYWPSLKALLLGLVQAGLTPMPFFEGDYTSRLQFLAELPPGTIIGHFDRVDRAKAAELIGDVMCFWGNVPSSLLVAGSVQEVKRDVRELIDLFAGNGGLIIDGSTGIPDEAKRENVFALTETVLQVA
jgi:uroporphyrinogen-III decarboxylase